MSKKIVWILQTGEPLLLDKNLRKMRSINLSEFLAESDIRVVHWTSNFDHKQKVHRFGLNNKTFIKSVDYSNNIKINLINSPGYKKNISILRLYDHWVMGKNLVKILKDETEIPDLVFIGFPPVEVCYQMSKWLKKKNIKYVIDVKDQWPDIFYDVFSRHLKPFLKVFLLPYKIMTLKLIKGATVVTGPSKSYINWANKIANRNHSKFDMVLPLVPNSKSYTQDDLKDATNWLKTIGIHKDGSMKILLLSTNINLKLYDLNIIKEINNLNLQYEKKIQFIICGTEENNEHIIQNSFSKYNNVFFVGLLDSKKLKALANISTLSWAPYKKVKNFEENITNKIYDSMAFGLPILTSLNGDTGDLISTNKIGLIYKDKSAVSLYESISFFYDSKKNWNEFSTNTLNLYKKNYSADIVYSSFVNFLKKKIIEN